MTSKNVVDMVIQQYGILLLDVVRVTNSRMADNSEQLRDMHTLICQSVMLSSTQHCVLTHPGLPPVDGLLAELGAPNTLTADIGVTGPAAD